MLGEFFKKEREKQGLTRKQLAEKVGVTKESIYYWEKEQKQMSLEHADKVAKALGISVVIGKDKTRMKGVD